MVVLPNGEDVVMSEEIFNQAPEFFINSVVGSMLMGRAANGDTIPTAQINHVGQRLRDEGATWDLYRKALEILI